MALPSTAFEFPKEVRVAALRQAIELERLRVTWMGVPRIQRELEGRSTRLVMEIVKPAIRLLVQASGPGRRGLPLESLRGIFLRLMPEVRLTARAIARDAARYGHNRMADQLGKSSAGLSAPNRGLSLDTLRRADVIADRQSERFIGSLDADLASSIDAGELDAQAIRKHVRRSVQSFSREDANAARTMAEYNAARTLGRGLVKKGWENADDARVRKSHIEVASEVVEMDEKFSNGLLYPKELGARLDEVMGCRCRLKVVPV